LEAEAARVETITNRTANIHIDILVAKSFIQPDGIQNYSLVNA
tara:strand:- start:346 stop:474 length:129 start_codon:yes stop_codon:yes gene_type:complete